MRSFVACILPIGDWQPAFPAAGLRGRYIRHFLFKDFLFKDYLKIFFFTVVYVFDFDFWFG